MFHNPNEEWYFSHENSAVQIESLFKYNEIESLIKSTPNSKSRGIDGVSYEDLEVSCNYYCHVLVNVMNVILINHRLSSYWKEAVLQRILKKKCTIENLSTLRDISLLPVCYKILSKAICYNNNNNNNIIIIIIIIIVKSIVATKTALLIKILSSHHHNHKSQKKLCSYKEIAW